MAEIVAFPIRTPEPDVYEFDLLTAVDAAIRDLRDIAGATVPDHVRLQAKECQAMLEQAYFEALG